MADSIDRLPDDVLTSVVSRLPLKDAQRASVLGHRWRYLWRCTSFLDFDTSAKFKACENKKTTFTKKGDFTDWVCKTMREHSGDTIKEFRIVVGSGLKPLSLCIDSWLRFAFTKRVERLELSLPFCHGGFEHRRYEFPNIADPIERLTAFNLITDCGSLSSLRLNQVEINGKAVECFLCNCPFLEELCVENSKNLVSLETENFMARRLRLLKISKCQSFEKLDIWAPNLGSCTLQWCSGDLIMSLKYDSPLIELNLGVGALSDRSGLAESLIQISGSMLSLETLRIEGDYLGLQTHALRYLEFPRLKTLVLDAQMKDGVDFVSSFAPLLEAVPLLSTLTVNIKFAFAFEIPRKTPSSNARCSRPTKNQNLEMLHMTGFVGIASDVELAKYVLGMYIGSIKKIVINFHLLTRGEIKLLKIEEMPMARKGFHILKKKVPRHVELVVA